MNYNTNSLIVLKSAKVSVGRPPVITNDAIRRLVSCLERGFSVDRSCKIVGIGRTAFYKKLKEDELFADQINKAKLFQILLASNSIFDILNDRTGTYDSSLKIRTAMWYLERKDPENWGKFTCKNPCCSEKYL